MEGLERLKKFRYKNIYYLGSLLWAGNTINYFSTHTEKFVVLYLLPRWETRKNFIQIYMRGKLIQEYDLYSPKLIVLQYPVLYLQYVRSLFRHFSHGEDIAIISFHPILLVGKSILALFFKIKTIFWIVDYFPHPTFFLSIYQFIIIHYHNSSKYNLYLTNRINKIMNANLARRNSITKTVMWGISHPLKKRKIKITNTISLFYAGVVKEEHGIDILFKVLKTNRNITIKILGKCKEPLYGIYVRMISSYGIENQVYFPNSYISDEELRQQSSDCLAAVALYIVSKDSYTYYADPGKLKLYAELGLPIITTNSSEIASIIKHYHAGEIVSRNPKSLYEGIMNIHKNYLKYQEGLEAFGKHFNSETYYLDNFSFLQ